MKTLSRTVEMPGGTVFTRSWHPVGSAGNTPVVLLHDSLGCVALWHNFPEALAQILDRPVVAYDRLGYGQSSAREGLPQDDLIEVEARECLPLLLDALEIGNCILLGHSIGGGIALAAASLAPGRYQAVITESALAFAESQTAQEIARAREAFRDPDQFEKLRRWHGDKARWVLDAWTELWLQPRFMSWSLDSWLPGVLCPVLAIHGDRDEFGTFESAMRIARGVSGPAQVEIVRDCGHVPHREHRGEVLELVSHFLERLPVA